MNTRWREIAVNCWEERTDGLHFDQEKFVELIIHECIEVMKANETMPVGYIQAKLVDTHSLAIKEHFGLIDDNTI